MIELKTPWDPLELVRKKTWLKSGTSIKPMAAVLPSERGVLLHDEAKEGVAGQPAHQHNQVEDDVAPAETGKH